MTVGLAHLLEGRILEGQFHGQMVQISQVGSTIKAGDDVPLPIVQCRQFPGMLAFAMAIYKAQGQTL